MWVDSTVAGDTGYGNAMNVKRTVRGYAQAGFAAVMIEDQAAPPQPQAGWRLSHAHVTRAAEKRGRWNGR